MVGFGSLLSSWDLSAFPHIIASISVLSGSVLLGIATSALAHNKGENIGKKRGNAIDLEGGNTPLHIASQKDAYQCVKTLVDQWAGRDQQKWRILKLAFSTIMNAISGGISASKPSFMDGFNESYNDLFFLTHRWDVNTANWDGYTPLHFAAENNSVRCLEALLGAGANINATDSKGLTALHFAAQNGYAESVKKLLDWSSRLNIKNNDGNTALHLAARQGKTEAIQKLLDFDPSLAKEKNNCGETAAHLAEMNGHKETVKLLNIEALHLAVRQGDMEAIQTLLGFDLSLAKEKDNCGKTALQLAAMNGHTMAVKALLTSDRSLGIEALHAAASQGHTATVAKLLEIDRSLAKEKDRFGETALHKAAENGHTEAIQKLLEIESSLAKEKDRLGTTALHIAAFGGHTEAIQTLLEIESSLAKEKDRDGDTALHIAAENRHTKAIQKLLEIDSSLGQREGFPSQNGSPHSCWKRPHRGHPDIAGD
ncbi:ankyrin repeat domain-containing protein [Endozoicomonas acroporae]|uniref:ankyrin repeat domain-containing protein n=1 Tax=Endozoicomonas acroporae TaxID=1701104 RepID=UPI0013D1DFF2|nr:ankyrin repeat domain-containing protein [Endozoicomonas acroporae]